MADNRQKAKAYSNIKYGLAIADIFYLATLLFLFLKLGFAASLAEAVSGLFAQRYATISVYFLCLFILYNLLTFPSTIYRSYFLEHQFGLSNQDIRNWLADWLKSGIISYIIAMIMIFAFYFILEHNPGTWWLLVSLFWIFFSLILARVTPTVIIPLFFKYKKLSDPGLRQRILSLAHQAGIKLLDVFEIDFSKKTLKANAAFVGIGRAKRVILADTLKDKYTHDEIEVILAHEFAHYKLKHLLKLVLLSSLSTLLIFYIIFRTNGIMLKFFGFSALSQVPALPVVFFYFLAFGIISGPLEAFFSRSMERSADRLALEFTHKKEAFISMMDKLAEQNLADRSPHPLIKFFFFDHPPIDERIKMADLLKFPN